MIHILDLICVCVSRSFLEYNAPAERGLKKYTVHAPIIFAWERSNSKAYSGRLNNLLYKYENSQEIKEEIHFFFDTNQGFAKLQVIWDTFKAYIR